MLEKIRRYWNIFTSHFADPKNRKVLSLITLAVIVAALPIIVLVAQQQQQTRQHAAESTPLFGASLTPNQSASGEVLVKFKAEVPAMKMNREEPLQGEQSVPFNAIEKDTIPSALNTINQKYKINKVEKIFKTNDNGTSLSNPQAFKEGQSALSRNYKLEFDKNAPIDQIISALKSDPQIEYAEPNYIYSTDSLPNDPYYLDAYPSEISGRSPSWNPPHDYQWNIKKTNSSSNFETDTSQVIVAVIDSGVDINHPDLGNVWTNTKEVPGDNLDNDNNGYVDDINGCNFTGGACENIADDNNHGTHVAGIISAKTNNNIGLAGITNNTPIMAIKAMDQNGYGNASNITKGIIYAVDNGARIINMSLSGPDTETMKQALDYATSNNVIVVVSASNGNAYSPSMFPASYAKAITVGGVDEELNKMHYASYGPNIDVSAPGGGKPCLYMSKPSYCSNIISLKSSQNNNDQDLVIDGKYLRDSGTSMAAPHVAGVIALLLAQHPQFTLQDIENYIRFNSIDPTNKGLNEKTGWGVINSTGTTFVPPSNIDFVINYPAENSLVGQTFNVAGTIKADNFDHYEVTYRLQNSSSWLTEGVTLQNNGKSQIIAPTNVFPLPTFAKAATINLPANSPRGIYEIKTILYMTNGKSIASTKTVNFLQKLGTNWLFTGDNSSSGGSTGNILTADLNNDGNKEIILYNYGSYNSKNLRVYDNKYNLLWQVDKAGEAVVGDIDKRSSTKEVILQISNSILVYDSNGKLIDDMTLTYYSDMSANIAVADADNNGIDELYFVEFTNSPNDIIHCFEQSKDFKFTEKWKYGAAGRRFNNFWPLIGDIDGDGQKEIIVLNTGKKIEAINTKGVSIAQYTYSNTNYDIDSIALADLDKDGKEEIIYHVQWEDLQVLKFSNNFNLAWTQNYPTNSPAISIADFNSDTYPDIYITSNNKDKQPNKIFDKNGNAIYQDIAAPLYWSFGNNASLPLGDRDNNGFVEVYMNGNYSVDSRSYLDVREYDYAKQEMNFIDNDWKPIIPQWTWLDGGVVDFSAPQLALDDLDNNGKLDLILPGIGIIEYNSPGKVFWPYRYHDFQRTGSYNFSPLSPTPLPSSTSTPTPTGKVSPCGNYGDVDMLDGRVTLADANLIAKYLVGNATLTDEQKKRADVNKDGKVSITDSLFIAQYVSGSRTTFPACQ